MINSRNLNDILDLVKTAVYLPSKKNGMFVNNRALNFFRSILLWKAAILWLLGFAISWEINREKIGDMAYNNRVQKGMDI